MSNLVNFVLETARQSLKKQCLGAAVVAHAAHIGYYIHWTRDTEALRTLVLHASAGCILLCVESYANGLWSGLLSGCTVIAAYLLGLFSSIAVYRIFFHPLRRFPGPLLAKISKFYVLHAQRNRKMHEVYDTLLNDYGDFVRIAPNEILHLSIDCLSEVHGPHSKCFKSDMYTTAEYSPHKILNLDNISDRIEHRYRRQVWDKGFNKAMAVAHEPMRKTIYEWLRKIDDLDGSPTDWTMFSSLIAFDITGQIAFSTDFGSVRSGEKTKLQKSIHNMFEGIAGLAHLPWITSLSTRMQSPSDGSFSRLAHEFMVQRLADTEYKEDIVNYFVEDYVSDEPKAFFTRDHVDCDAMAILTGAADSTSAALTFCLRHLVLNPSAMQALRDELELLFGRTDGAEFSDNDLASAKYLEAVINETLRLYSPTCTNGPRQTPPEGITLSCTHIPGNVNLISSIWSIQRSDKFFVRPLDWIPERWTSQPELVLDGRAFHPFSIGPFDCVAKKLALMTIRMVIAYTVWHCDVELAEGEDGMIVAEEAKNHIFLKPGPLHLLFTRRTR